MKVMYFDHAATTAVNKRVLEEMIPYFNLEYGNPSALYSIGRKNKRAIENARMEVSKVLNCKPKEIYFTSCGSESDNLALKGIAKANKSKGKHIITSKIEHHAILNSCKCLEKEGYEITYLNVDSNGVVNLEELKSNIREDTILISIMFANNEIGTIEPIQEISNIAHDRNVIFHTDCVQAIGNIKVDVQKLGIDMLSLSAHKFYGPKGIGALYVKDGIEFDALINGGHQEKNKRAGTENVAEIVGLAKAIQLADENIIDYNKKLIEFRNYFIYKIKENIKDIKINGDMKNRLSGNVNISFKGIDGEQLLFELDNKGICASTASACSSEESEPSHVLKAIGVTDEFINGSLRISFGDDNKKDDVDYLIKSLIEIVEKLRNNNSIV